MYQRLIDHDFIFSPETVSRPIVSIVVNWKKITLLYKLVVYFTYTISLLLWLSLVEQLQPENTNSGNSAHVVDAEPSSEIVLTAV